MLRFISPDQLFTSVKSMLESYDQAGLLDETYWYPLIREGLFDIGLFGAELLQIDLPVKKYKVRLPKYLQSIEELYLIADKTGSCDVTPLYPVGKHHGYKHLLNPRQAPHPQYVYKQKNDELQLEFETGKVRLIYYGLSIDDEQIPQVPDDTTLLRYLQRKIVYKQFEKWYYDGTVPNIEQRYQKSEIDFAAALREANYYAKLPMWKDLILDKLNGKHILSPRFTGPEHRHPFTKPW